MEIKWLFPLLYSMYIQCCLMMYLNFEIIFKEICSRNPAARQWHSATLHTTEFYTDLWHGLALVISIASCKRQMQLQLTIACSWTLLLKTWVWHALLSSSSSSTEQGLCTSVLHIYCMYYCVKKKGDYHLISKCRRFGVYSMNETGGWILGRN